MSVAEGGGAKGRPPKVGIEGGRLGGGWFEWPAVVVDGWNAALPVAAAAAATAVAFAEAELARKVRMSSFLEISACVRV